jgi:hypothetical protein
MKAGRCGGLALRFSGNDEELTPASGQRCKAFHLNSKHFATSAVLGRGGRQLSFVNQGAKGSETVPAGFRSDRLFGFFVRVLDQLRRQLPQKH